MATTKQSVTLPEETIQKIQQIYLAGRRSTHGAIQEVLARGAELALQELEIHGLPKAGLPQKENINNLFSVVSNKTASYNLKTAQQKSMEAASALTEAISAIEKALGGVVDELDPLAFVGDAAKDSDNTVRESREIAQEFADDGGDSEQRKHGGA